MSRTSVGGVTTISEPTTAAIQRLNDQLRTTGSGGRVMVTAGLLARGKPFVALALTTVATFTAFDRENDPHEEHDAGIVDVQGDAVLWNVDYYDRALAAHSPDPADPSVTERVMTVMLAEEY